MLGLTLWHHLSLIVHVHTARIRPPIRFPRPGLLEALTESSVDDIDGSSGVHKVRSGVAVDGVEEGTTGIPS
jgi:hypothetical protein